MKLTETRQTYVRKIGIGQFEYGYVSYANNFRKRGHTYAPSGVSSSVAEAELARAALAQSVEKK